MSRGIVLKVSQYHFMPAFQGSWCISVHWSLLPKELFFSLIIANTPSFTAACLHTSVCLKPGFITNHTCGSSRHITLLKVKWQMLLDTLGFPRAQFKHGHFPHVPSQSSNENSNQQGYRNKGIVIWTLLTQFSVKLCIESESVSQQISTSARGLGSSWL